MTSGEHGPGRSDAGETPSGVTQFPLATGHSQQANLGAGIQYVSFGSPSSVPLAAAVRDAQLVFSAAGVAGFTGREWLLADIDRFIKASQSGYVLIEAEAGLGKTAFVAWLVKERGYVSHFSRYSGGRSVKAALQNMSAQLILRFGLGDLAPGGILPDWAHTPGGFEHVLGQAAAQVSASGEPLVLVVDGLDEAEQDDEGGLPFGLPLLLPDGVFVIGTYRTGAPLTAPAVPLLSARISQGDPRNARDIQRFLAAAVQEEELSARLAEAETAPAGFVDLLARRCQGVWIYLRYVLEEVRLGLRRADAIGDLPTGLYGYYADQVRRWQHDPAWDDCLVPLLATLGVAGEPLPAATLAALAGGLDARVVRRLCDLTLRPLLTTARSGPQTTLRYEVYHASFRQLLKAGHAESVGLVPYDLEALTDQLGLASIQAHSRIADIYLGGFGGLGPGLPVLAQDPHAAEADDGYPLRHLARHLHHAGRVSDLHRLLAVSRPVSRDHEDNVWFTAHDTAGSLADYLDDLARARTASAATAEHAAYWHQPTLPLGTEVRYALMAASITSRSARIYPQLLERLVQTGLWSPGRAVDHARSLIAPRDRHQALLTILDHVAASERPALLGEALATAITISSERDRALALADLAPHLDADQLDRALTVAVAMSDEYDRALVLAHLVPHLTPGQQGAVLDQAFSAVINISIEYNRALALGHLAPRLTPGQRAAVLDQALTDMTAIKDESRRAWALAALAPHMNADQLDRALALAVAVPTIVGDELRISASLPQSYSFDFAFNSKHPPARALAALAPHLNPGQLDRALTAALALSNEYSRADALVGLTPYLNPDQLDQALAAAFAEPNPNARALAGLVPHLSADRKADILDRALASAATIDIGDLCARALIDLAAHLDPDQLERALAAADAIGYEYDRAWALTGLARYLPPDRKADVMGRALAAATDIGPSDLHAEALAGLTPHLNSRQLEGVLAAATAIRSEYCRALAMIGLAQYLPPGQKADVMGQVLAATINGEYSPAELLASLAPHLNLGQLDHALATSITISDEDSLAEALVGLAPYLSPGQLDHAVAAAVAISDKRSRAGVRGLELLGRFFSSKHPRVLALAGLAPYLNAGQLDQAVAAAIGIRDGHDRVSVLTDLAPYLTPDEQAVVMDEALATAAAMSDEYDRACALTGLVPYLAPGQQAAALDQVLAAAAAIDYEHLRTQVLTGLAPHLSPGRFDRALALAIAIAASNDHYGAQALVGLAAHLTTGQLDHALVAAIAIDNDYSRADALVGLIPHLVIGQIDEALAAATAFSNEYARARVLTALAPHLPPDRKAAALDRALADAAAIGEEYVRARMLSRLAPHLAPDQQTAALDRALADAATISDENSRAKVLVDLAPHLAPAHLLQALAMTPKNSVPAITSILRRAETALSATESGTFFRVFSASLTDKDRDTCLKVVALMSPTIARMGGGKAVQDCVAAIIDIHKWWP